MPDQRTDKSWMRRAIAVGRNGLGTTAPNPAVGAVIVKDGKLISKGFHHKSGHNHAEVEAINAAGKLSKDATLYVTLEPCNHFGQTPPCSDAILKSGIKRVVVAISDPNLNVKGGGAAVLKAKALDVTVGLCKEEAEFLIAPFLHGLTHTRPFVTLKLAVTKNGMLTTGRPEEPWLSSNASKAFVQRLRSRADCILVGKNTVIQDNPYLTNRLGRGSRPLRVYLDSNSSVKKLGHLSDNAAATVCLCCTAGSASGQILCARDKNDRVDLADGLKKLFGRGIRNLLCEGGATLAASLLEQGLVDRMIIIGTPIIGSEGGVVFGTDFSGSLKLVGTRNCGQDTLSFYSRS